MLQLIAKEWNLQTHSKTDKNSHICVFQLDNITIVHSTWQQVQVSLDFSSHIFILYRIRFHKVKTCWFIVWQAHIVLELLDALGLCLKKTCMQRMPSDQHSQEETQSIPSAHSPNFSFNSKMAQIVRDYTMISNVNINKVMTFYKSKTAPQTDQTNSQREDELIYLNILSFF